jgi:hypothetical protein
MWEYGYSVTTYTTREQIWQTLADVEHWSQWNHEIEWCKYDDAFERNRRFILKLKGKSPMESVVSEDHFPQHFSNTIFLFKAKVKFSYRIEKKNNATQLTYHMQISGPFTFLYSHLIGNKMKNEIPLIMKNLIIVAASKYETTPA